MNLLTISAGLNVPNEFNVIIEISAKSDPVKYEFDKQNGLLVVDRFVATDMRYPVNYGFIPKTLAGDGDPVDVLVYTPYPLIPGSLIACRALGILKMTDESGSDGKVMAVPVNKVCAATKNIIKIQDLPDGLCDQVKHFFENYKKMEPGKWVEVIGWDDVCFAHKEILEGIERFSKESS